MTNAMNELATGSRTVPIPATDRGDEIGVMAQAVQVFKESLIRDDQMAADAAAAQAVQLERAARVRQLASDFARTVEAARTTGAVSTGIMAAASELAQGRAPAPHADASLRT